MAEANERRAGRGRRALRGAAASAIAVLFAGAAHTLSGGDAPPLWLMIAVTILATPASVLLVGRRRNLGGLAAAVVAAQSLLHVAFASVGTSDPSMGGFSMHHAHLSSLTFGPADAAGAVMTAGHLVAAAVTFVVLAWGERMLSALARGIRRLIARPVGFVPLLDARIPRISARRAPARAATVLRAFSRRGPPTRLASAFTPSTERHPCTPLLRAARAFSPA